MPMKKFILVDDSPVLIKVAARILDTMQIESVGAQSGEEALAMCAQEMPDGVIVDWTLPDMEAASFLTRLRDMPDGEKPTVIYCTTENDILQIATVMRAGANGFLMKPFDRAALRDTLAELEEA
jgi:two-component system chemotaxis response regulator CheY